MVAIFVVLTILGLVGVDALLQARRRALAPVPVSAASPAGLWREPALPAGLFVSPGHAWVELQRSGLVRVGLDDFVRHAVGDPDRLVMRRSGEQVRQGDPLVTVSRDGRELVVRAPLSGTIQASNDQLAAAPARLQQSSYGNNWVCAIQPSRLGEEIGGLQVAERASRWLQAELNRMADWFSSLAPVQPGMAMQDGGLPASGALNQIDAAAWHGFQSEFLDHQAAV